jgi:hypothetical protein
VLYSFVSWGGVFFSKDDFLVEEEVLFHLGLGFFVLQNLIVDTVTDRLQRESCLVELAVSTFELTAQQ